MGLCRWHLDLSASAASLFQRYFQELVHFSIIIKLLSFETRSSWPFVLVFGTLDFKRFLFALYIFFGGIVLFVFCIIWLE